MDGDAGGRRQDVGEMKWWGWVVGVCIRILYGVLFIEIAEVGGENRWALWWWGRLRDLRPRDAREKSLLS